MRPVNLYPIYFQPSTKHYRVSDAYSHIRLRPADMGVTGLWTVVQPCARPIKIETLNKKRLAVDASIWIYQFLKAVRDKEGNALRNSHVVGFFRRICKLLFIGIKPVFVFDGGAPALKRQTISARKQRREGRREDATRTAGKLLALQMQRLAEEEEEKRRRDAHRAPDPDEEELPENMVYVDELQMTQQERQQNRKFRKKDQYHLPDLDVSLAEMGQPNDPRIMSLEELEAYARQFDTGEDINVYDFSKIDFDSPFFVSLPASDRYNILNAARLRSRLRMGYSKEQLDTMFPDRMAFSKFQIERVRERNDLTQRLMNLNGMNDDTDIGRVAGEKGREYVLVRNDGVEGGWALGVVSAKDEGEQSKPIDVDELGKQVKEEDEDEWEDADDFEDVPIEGLNRLPKRTAIAQPPADQQATRHRRASYASRRRGMGATARPRSAAKPKVQDPNSLFVEGDEEEDMEWEQVPEDTEIPDAGDAVEDEDLQRAIAMSLEKETSNGEQEDYLDLFEQTRVEEEKPLPKGSAQAIAHILNNRANKAAPAAKSVEPSGSEDEEDDMDLQAALAESRKTKYKPKTLKPPSPKKPERRSPVPAKPGAQPAKAAPQPSKKPGFDGPLPFEKLDLGSSLLGKKKMQKLQEESAGGFERLDTGPQQHKKAEPLPPWFAGNLDDDIAAQNAFEKEDRQKAHDFDKSFQFEEPSVLRRSNTLEVIDLEESQNASQNKEVIDIESDAEDKQPSKPTSATTKVSKSIFTVDSDEEDEALTPGAQPTAASNSTKMGDLADSVRAAPPTPPPADVLAELQPTITKPASNATITTSTLQAPELSKEQNTSAQKNPVSSPSISAANDEAFQWSESDTEDPATVAEKQPTQAVENKANQEGSPSRSPSPDFEDVDIQQQPPEQLRVEGVTQPQAQLEMTTEKPTASGLADQNVPPEPDGDEFGYYSDSEDEELMRQLEVEAEEHARFASELNHRTQQQNIEDYERELKQLRSQQKRDRRDADEVTHIMIQECQQLLKLFGLPYITAPMEAEAQCAELVSLGLVDGIVTDDSDCFLFGGTRIYKNMFNQAKFVECYLTTDFEKEFDLTRPKLIGIAHLLGSDYTEGLPGVGPVTALEILSEFPSLAAFRDWFNGVQNGTIAKSADAGNALRKKLRRQATKITLPPPFPDPRVDAAYLQPEVDSDPQPFQWGVPDLDALRSFLMATIGWSQERTDEVLVPVIRDMNRRVDEGTQSNITAFFGGTSGAGAYAPRQRVETASKRMGGALERMALQARRKRKGGVVDEGEGEGEGADDGGGRGAEEPTARKKKKTKRSSTRSSKRVDEEA